MDMQPYYYGQGKPQTSGELVITNWKPSDGQLF